MKIHQVMGRPKNRWGWQKFIFLDPNSLFIVEVHLALKQVHKHSALVKNPNWQEANQLTIYKRSRGVEPKTRFQVRHPDHSATLPP